MTDHDDLDDGEDTGLTDASWWIETYDDKGNAYKTPQSIANLRKEVMEEWLGEVNAGRLPRPQVTDELLAKIARTEFDNHVGQERNRRSNRLTTDAEFILDAIPEDDAYVDPLLSQVHRVGDRTDAPLRYWTKEMWLTWSDGRFKGAQEAMDAAAKAVAIRQRMAKALEDAHVVYTGDLPQCQP